MTYARIHTGAYIFNLIVKQLQVYRCTPTYTHLSGVEPSAQPTQGHRVSTRDIVPFG